MKLMLFTLPTKLAAPADSSRTMTKQTAEPVNDAAPFSYNPTVLGHRYWIKGNAQLLENGTCVAQAETIFNKNLGICQDVKGDARLEEALGTSISHHLKAHTFRKHSIHSYSIHF